MVLAQGMWRRILVRPVKLLLNRRYYSTSASIKRLHHCATGVSYLNGGTEAASIAFVLVHIALHHGLTVKR